MSSHHRVTTGAIECPLASLGHNTPSLDQSYHHPLSTSPLNPEAYQMLRKSQESPILSLDADKIRFTAATAAARRPTAVIGGDQTFPPPRHSTQMMMMTTHDHNTSALLSRRDLQRIRNQTYTPNFDSILPSYQQACTNSIENHEMVAISGLHHEITDVERYFLGDKMASLIIDSAIRNNSKRTTTSSSNNSTSSGSTTTSSTNNNNNLKTTSTNVPANTNNNGSNNRSSLSDVDRIESADRYFLDQQDRSSTDGGGGGGGGSGGGSGYNYYSIPTNNNNNSSTMMNGSNGGHHPRLRNGHDEHSSGSPTLRRRASSPDTSGSDRYFLDRLRGSPAFVSRNAKVANIKSTDSPSNGR